MRCRIRLSVGFVYISLLDLGGEKLTPRIDHREITCIPLTGIDTRLKMGVPFVHTTSDQHKGNGTRL